MLNSLNITVGELIAFFGFMMPMLIMAGKALVIMTKMHCDVKDMRNEIGEIKSSHYHFEKRFIRLENKVLVAEDL